MYLDDDSQTPIVIDLDGTLIKTDLLYESFILLLKKNFFYIFLCFFWLLKGVANLKHQIASRVEINIDALPYNNHLISFIESQKHEIYLATAANEKFAEQIYSKFSFIKSYFASDETVNLMSKTKAKLLIEKFGEQGFEYFGDSGMDVEVWKHASRANLVDCSGALADKVKRLLGESKVNVFSVRKFNFKSYIKQIRVHQWVKNLLVFFPIIAAHQIDNIDLVTKAMIAFVAFSLCASSVYMLNDLLDLEDDRLHKSKSSRPLAAGLVSIKSILLLIPIFLFAAFAFALSISMAFTAVLLLYYFLTVFYSFFLKRVVILDCILLASLYAIRTIAGGVAASVDLSFWFIAFSIFVFLSLAFLKRYAELVNSPYEDKESSARGYIKSDAELIAGLGIASSFISVLILVLYINSYQAQNLYHYPYLLSIICLLCLYWFSRAWLLTHRAKMHDDPVLFAIKDPVSIVIFLLVLLIVYCIQ